MQPYKGCFPDLFHIPYAGLVFVRQSLVRLLSWALLRLQQTTAVRLMPPSADSLKLLIKICFSSPEVTDPYNLMTKVFMKCVLKSMHLEKNKTKATNQNDFSNI